MAMITDELIIARETLTSESDGSSSDMTTTEVITNYNNNLTSNVVDVESFGTLPGYGYALCIISMLLIWLVGSIGNFLVVYIVCKEKQLRTPMNMFLVNLSTADFITAAFGSPFPFFASIYGYWPFGETMCIIYGFGMSVGGITSITTLMVLAFERYLMIARPFRAADLRLHHSAGIVFLIWFYSLTITLPPLFGWATYGPEGPYISCSVSWERDDLTTKSYICFLFVLGLVLPLFTIIFSYAGIVSTIKSTSQTQVCSRTATSRAELRVLTMVFIMIACFMIAWSPYSVMSLMVAFGGPRGRKLITPLASILPAIFAKSATCYNPFIYVGLNTQFRTAWMNLFGITREDVEAQTGLTLSVGGITQAATAGPQSGIKLASTPSPRCTTPNISHPPSGSSIEKPILHLPLSPSHNPTLAEEEVMKLLSPKSEATDALELAPLDKGKSPLGETTDTDINLHTMKMEESGCDRAESIEL